MGNHGKNNEGMLNAEWRCWQGDRVHAVTPGAVWGEGCHCHQQCTSLVKAYPLQTGPATTLLIVAVVRRMFELHRYWWDLHLSGIFIVYKIFPISCSVCFSNWTMGRHLRPGTGANIHKSYSRTRPPPTQHHHCCWAAVAVVVVTTLYSWILIPALEITSLLNWWHCVRRWLGLWVANSEAKTSDQQKQIEIKS